MPFKLPDLPFAKDALGRIMSAETLEFHHGKHHKAYVDKTNELLGRRADLSGASLIEVIRAAKEPATTSCSTTARSSGTTASSGNAWRRPRASSPTASSRKLIEDGFGSADALLAEAEGRSGQPFRQRLGLAGARPRQRCGSPRSTTPTRRSSTTG